MDHSIRLFFGGHEQTLPGHACGPGVWPHYLLHYVLSGSGIFHIEKKTFRLGAGDGFLIPPGTICAYSADKEMPWEYCWIGFDGGDTAKILHSCGLTAKTPVIHQEDPAIAGCLLELKEVLHRQPANHYLHLSWLYRFFALLSPAASASRLGASDYFRQAADYIDHNYAYDIHVQDIARHIGIDRTYLYEIFMREVQQSPQQYLIEYRLQTAKQLLKNTGLRINEISNSCGFQDAAAFCNHFKRKMGMSPSQFRKEPGGTPYRPLHF